MRAAATAVAAALLAAATATLAAAASVLRSPHQDVARVQLHKRRWMLQSGMRAERLESPWLASCTEVVCV